jgi:hypothetical protein
MMKPVSRLRKTILSASLVAPLAWHGASRAQDALPPGVWTRRFDLPQELSVTVTPIAESFLVKIAGLGTVREATEAPLHTAGGGCVVTTSLEAAPTGFDIVYTISNPASHGLAMPALQVDGFVLDSAIAYLNHRYGCTFEPMISNARGLAVAPRTPYPEELYAPVIVVRDDRLAVGLSLRFPLLEYRHQVETQVVREAGADTVTARFWLMGELAPGDTRTYTLSVRFGLPEEWIHTLAPYRDHFRSLYGTVRYGQDLRPVFGTWMSQGEFISAQNPRGMLDDRPDLNGWTAVIDRVLTHARENGFQRVMIWKPSGLYRIHQHNNFPPQMMSSWPGPMVQTASEWLRFAQAGIDLSFWWGRAAQYADRWDDDRLDAFDPANPIQRAGMLAEWNLAVARGATGVGLDAFSFMPPWKAIPWIATLRTLLPQASIVAEPTCCDLLHVHAPMFVQSRHLPEPHLLADYLVPGREFWANLQNHPADPDHASLGRAIELVRWGMTVCVRELTVSALDLEEEIEELLRGEQSAEAPVPLIDPDELYDP